MHRTAILPVVYFVNFFLFSVFLIPSRTLSASEEMLQSQIQELKQGQKSIEKELGELKDLMLRLVSPGTGSPQNLTIDITDRPIKGANDAKLVLVGFSDYQCPFCARFAKETLPKIDQEFISTGKLKYVIRDLPIESIHRHALTAAEAVNCAGEQGKYWQAHDWVFDNQSRFETDENFVKGLIAVGLNQRVFEECVAGGKYAAKIRRDIQDAQRAGVQGTPTFFIGLQDNDAANVQVIRTIIGAQPYTHFKEALEEAFKQVKN